MVTDHIETVKIRVGDLIEALESITDTAQELEDKQEFLFNGEKGIEEARVGLKKREDRLVEDKDALAIRDQELEDREAEFDTEKALGEKTSEMIEVRKKALTKQEAEVNVKLKALEGFEKRESELDARDEKFSKKEGSLNEEKQALIKIKKDLSDKEHTIKKQEQMWKSRLDSPKVAKPITS